MSYMFTSAISFCQPIHNWNTGRVQNMYNIFEETAAADLLWKQVSKRWTTSYLEHTFDKEIIFAVLIFKESSTYNPQWSEKKESFGGRARMIT